MTAPAWEAKRHRRVPERRPQAEGRKAFLEGTGGQHPGDRGAGAA